MFIQAIILALVLGYIFKGRLKNLQYVEVKGLYLIAIAFLIEFAIVMLIRKGVIRAENATFIADLIMYTLLFVFTLLNRKNPYILIMALGFILNAVAIFSNGGAMPVSSEAYKSVGLTNDVVREGLYSFINENTRFAFLGDIIPYKFISSVVVSIGDLIIALGLIGFVISAMRSRDKSHKAHA